MLSVILIILVTWRLTTFIVSEDGPYEVFEKIRHWFTRKNYSWIELRCFDCMSVWIALPLAILLADGLLDIFLLWLAGSAGAILLENILERLRD